MFNNLKQNYNAPNTSFGFTSNVNPNPFGQSAFGKAPSTGFGAPAPAFGQQSAPLFGQTAQHASLFASAAPTNTFGQPVNAQPAFGGGMFGNTASQPSSSGLFGAGTAPTFGQQSKTTGFGFGANTANTGFGFGQTTTQVQPQPQNPGLFGQTPNLFGQSSGFGASTASNQVGTVIKFTPVTGTDTMVKGSINQTISTRHYCITCMKEYETKSLEELRWEDYQVNRKGPQQGAQPTGGLFSNMSQPVGAPLFGSGAAATSSNTLFGQQDNKSVFGQSATASGYERDMFNYNPYRPFSRYPTSNIGNHGTGFGQTTPAFGTTPATSTSAGLFGKSLTGFGSTATATSAFPFSSTAQTNNLFGSSTATKPAFGVSAPSNTLFGQPAGFGTQPAFGAFGSTTNQNVGLFNQNKTTPFNIMPTSATNTFGSFAQPGTQNNSLFSGAKPNTGFGFGQSGATPVFGQPSFGQTNQGIFNSSFNKTQAPLFGQPQPTNNFGTGFQMGGNSSLFGNNINKPNTMFGNNMGLFNSGFGTNTNMQPFNIGGNYPQPGMPNPEQIHTQLDQQIMSMSSNPYGIQPLLNDITEVSADLKDCARATNPAELNALLNTVRKSHSPAPTDRLKPVQIFGRKVQVFDGLETRDETLISNMRISSNPKRLVIRSHLNKHKDQSLDDSGTRSSLLIVDNDSANVTSRSLTEEEPKRNLYPDLQMEELSSTSFQIDKITAVEDKDSFLNVTSTTASMPLTSTMISSSPKVSFTCETIIEEGSDNNEDDLEQFTEASESQDWQTDDIRGVVQKNSTTELDVPATVSSSNSGSVQHPTGIILTKLEYYTVPSLDELVKYISEDGSCVVKGFTVGRYGYGSVSFSEAFDVSNLNLDELVYFRHKEINIYPDDSKKPPRGQGLNRKAQVTLDNVWPFDRKAKALVTDIDSLTKMDYCGRLRRLCERQNTRFVEYRPDTGSWVFKVEHFSIYGHRESDDDDDIEMQKPGAKATTSKTVTKDKETSESTISADNDLPSKESVQLTKKSSKENTELQDKSLENNIEFQDAFSEETNATVEKSSTESVRKYTDTFLKESMEQNSMLSRENVEMKASLRSECKILRIKFPKKQLNAETLDMRSSCTGIDHSSEETSDLRQTFPEGSIAMNDLTSSEMNELRNTPSTSQQHKKCGLFVDLDDYELPVHIPFTEQDTTSILMKSNFFETQKVDFADNISDVCSSEGGILELSNYVSRSSPKRIREEELYDDSYILEDELVPLDIYKETEIIHEMDNILILPDMIALKPVNRDSYVPMYCNSVDARIFKGRSYKVGWAKNSTMLCLSQGDLIIDNDIAAIADDSVKNLKFRFIEKKKIRNVHEQAFQNLEQHLENQLKWSGREDRSGIPYFASLYNPHKLQNHQEIANNLSRDNYEKQIWELMVTLFDNNSKNNTGKIKIFHEEARKAKFSIWLRSVVESKVDSEVNDLTSDYFSKIFSCISGNMIERAAKLAMESENVNLAMLITQLPTSKMAQSAIIAQLMLWEKCDVYDHLDEIILKIYTILSGNTLLKVADKSILVYEGMDWIRMLGMFFWYAVDRASPLATSINVYENTFKEFNGAIPPRPDYDNPPEDVFDLRYHLLKFYSDKTHPLTNILNTFTHTNDPLDYRLSWFVFQTLDSLGHVDISKRSKNCMHMNFATQLEYMGLWHWAIFVLMFIDGNEIKQNMIMDILGRHIELLEEASEDYKRRERMLVKQFKIPIAWIEYQKAIKAISFKNYDEGVSYLCYAKEWEFADKIIMRHLIPDHLLGYDYEYIIDLLTPLSGCQDLLTEWEESGGLILDFAKLGIHYDQILSLKDPDMINKQLISFRTAVINVSVRLKHFTPLTFMHDVCLAEMSGRIAVMLRILLTVINGQTYELCVDTAINAQTLPVTSDYLKQELNSTLIAYLGDVKPKRTYL